MDWLSPRLRGRDERKLLGKVSPVCSKIKNVARTRSGGAAEESSPHDHTEAGNNAHTFNSYILYSCG